MRPTAQIERLLESRDSITPVFQPIVELGTGNIVGYEALPRFVDHGGRPPDAWFAQAHRCGLGIPLELHALRAALSVESRPESTFLSVNLSPTAAVSPDVPAMLPDDLSWLVIELLASGLIAESERLQTALEPLRARGARIAVGHTDSRFAGLRQLMRLEPDIIKLDRSLVHAVGADTFGRTLVESLVSYGRRVGASLCAEGTESLEDVSVLADLDIPWSQGPALARPGPAWPGVAAGVTDVCAASLSPVLRRGGTEPTLEDPGRRLEHISRTIADAKRLEDLDAAMSLIAEELHADEVTISRTTASGNCLRTVASNTAFPPNEEYALFDYPLTLRSLANREAMQVIVSKHGADPDEVHLLHRDGFGSLLMLPLIVSSRAVGLLELAAVPRRSWTSTEITRAWVHAHQLGAALIALESAQPAYGEVDLTGARDLSVGRHAVR
jgi:EAL domain-containing protein (putative c-di-GMP-specific phosphodiesterase class I)